MECETVKTVKAIFLNLAYSIPKYKSANRLRCKKEESVLNCSYDYLWRYKFLKMIRCRVLDH